MSALRGRLSVTTVYAKGSDMSFRGESEPRHARGTVQLHGGYFAVFLGVLWKRCRGIYDSIGQLL